MINLSDRELTAEDAYRHGRMQAYRKLPSPSIRL